VLQFANALRLRGDLQVDLRLKSIVQNDQQWKLLERLSAYDRAHHLGVYDSLIVSGWTNEDLLLAAALHDVGKADDVGRVRVAHRVALVLFGRTSPGLLMRLASTPGSRTRHGFYLAVHHAALGAALAADAGAPERCCQLIAGHHDDRAALTDPDLLALMSADQGSPV
jgi:hypothetical protein